MPPDLDTFWRSHILARRLAMAAIELGTEVFSDLHEPLIDPALERFRLELLRIYDATFHPDDAPARPNLRIVQ